MGDYSNRNPQRGRSILMNMLTAAILLATLAVVAIYAVLFINPNLPFNPFPPPTLPPTLQRPTASNTPPVYLPPTWTATVDNSTATPEPSSTPEPTSTFTNTPPPTATATTDPNATVEPSPTSTPFEAVYILQANSPSYTENFANGDGCEWMGIAGQVFDIDSDPALDISVHLSGTLAGQSVDLYAESGSQTAYGPAGYEFSLGDQPVTSTNTLWIQIFDQEESAPISEKIFLSTYNDCSRNLILVNWNQIKE